jgi:hypothetical protein
MPVLQRSSFPQSRRTVDSENRDALVGCVEHAWGTIQFLHPEAAGVVHADDFPPALQEYGASRTPDLSRRTVMELLGIGGQQLVIAELDEWFEEVVKPRLQGEAYEIRFADDAILCFQHKEDAEKVLRVLPKRFEKYGLTLHPEKTRLMEFGRYAVGNAKKQGKKPETFDFLGLTHICARSRKGKFTVHVKTVAKRFRRGLKAAADWCEQHRHDPVSEQQKMLNAKLRGHYQYYGRSTNYRSLWRFYRKVRRIWRTWLSRRTRGTTLTWERFAELLRQYPLLRPRITHSWAGAGSNA